MNRVKLLAATLIVAGGLGAGAGGWLSRAGAQDKPAGKQEWRYDLLQWAETDEMKAKSSNWDHKLVAVDPGYAPTATDFQAMLRTQEASGGWLFVGQITTRQKDGGAVPTLVFRRPKPPAAAKNDTATDVARVLLFDAATVPASDPATLIGFLNTAQANQQSKTREQRIDELEKELARLRSGVAEWTEVGFAQKDLPLGVSELRDVLGRIARKRFGDDALQFGVSADYQTLTVRGEKSRVDWAAGILRALSAATAPQQPAK